MKSFTFCQTESTLWNDVVVNSFLQCKVTSVTGGEYSGDVKQLEGNRVGMWNSGRRIEWGCETAGGEYSGDVKQLEGNIAGMWNSWRGIQWGCETAGGEYSGDVKQLEGNTAGMWNSWRGIQRGCETAGGEYSGDVKQLEGNIVGMWNNVLPAFRFLQRCCCGFSSSCMWSRVTGCAFVRLCFSRPFKWSWVFNVKATRTTLKTV